MDKSTNEIRLEKTEVGQLLFDVMAERDDLRAENERLRASRTCLLAGPGRGDCEHFIGWPEVEDETTTDEWGVPTGWCIVCYWRHKALARDQCR